MYKRILQSLLKNFFVTKGRAPVSAAEWSKLRKEALDIVKRREKTAPFDEFKPKIVPKGGIPDIRPKITIDDLLKGPVRSKGPKGPRIWDFSQKRGDMTWQSLATRILQK